MEKTFLDVLDREINDIQAKIDEADIFGGDTGALKDTLAELIGERAAEQSRNQITLERGNQITPSRIGAWGRSHYINYALGSRDADDDHKFWVCTLCGKEITQGESHYRRSYYLNKADNKTGRQARICEQCHEKHEIAFPALTTFQVFRPARQKAA